MIWLSRWRATTCGRSAPAANSARRALALKLAEVQMMREETGDTPLLLLDDVMSELDASGGRRCWTRWPGWTGVVTTTDWGDFTPELLAQARQWRVEQGTLAKVTG